MAVILNRAYAGSPAGAVVQLTSDVEAALITQGLASAGVAANTTSGAITVNAMSGKASVPAAASSVVVTNALVDAQSKVFAVVAQAAADATALRVERVVCAAGSFTVFVTANATAATLIDWAVMVPAGGLTIKN